MIAVLKIAYNQLVGFLLSVLGRTKNPVNDARRIVQELSEQISQVEAVAAEVLAQDLRIVERKTAALSSAEEFGRHAETAAAKGDMDLARKCVERQMEYEAQVAELDAELAHVTPRVQAIRGRLEELRRSLSSASRELAQLETRYAVSKAGIKASKLLKEVKGYDAGGEMSKVREAVANTEALARAVDEINTTEEERLDARVEALRASDRSREIEARMARLQSGKADAQA
jgi:phage shock protein A